MQREKDGCARAARGESSELSAKPPLSTALQALSGPHKDKAGAVYLELRVQSLKDDHKEVQILREGLEVLGEPTLENAKRKVEHTSYLITIFGFLEKTYYVSDGSTKQTKFQTNSLLELHKWLDENIN